MSLNNLNGRIQEKNYFEHKVKFLNAISGQKVAEENMAINSDPDMFVIATQQEQRDTPRIKNPDDENKHFKAYDAWIYYVVKKKVEQPNQQQPQGQPVGIPQTSGNQSGTQPVQVGPQPQPQQNQQPTQQPQV